MKLGKEIIVIGDIVLISPDTDKSRTETGLYLPQGLAEKERVQSGYVVKIGPGYIIPESDSSEPWRKKKKVAMLNMCHCKLDPEIMQYF